VICKLGSLYVRMLRYRAALMIWMFLLLGAGYDRGLEGLDLEHLWAVVALASSYVCATTVNDIADKDIDRVNHPRDAGRPLVIGEAQERELYVLNSTWRPPWPLWRRVR
jgi:4-hydroxybenzoate polyprenyltransferase